MKKLFVLLFAVMLVLAGCGSAKDSSDKKDKDASDSGSKDERITIGTGGTSGTYYPLGVAMAQQIFNKTDGVAKANAVSTGASVTNVQEMGAGKYQLALVQNDIAYYGLNGTTLKDFEGKKVDNIAGLTSLYPEDIQIVTTADSKIKTLDDLKGKKVAVGDQGSGAEANARQILEAADITYKDLKAEYLGFADASQGLQNGTIDAAFITAGAPTTAIQELGANKKVNVLSLDKDLIKKLTEKYPYYTERSIPAKTYSDYGQKDDIATVAVMAILVVDKNLSEDVVYNMTKDLFENQEKLKSAHARGADITLETALDGMSIDLHPGAKKYFDEKDVKAK